MLQADSRMSNRFAQVVKAAGRTRSALWNIGRLRRFSTSARTCAPAHPTFHWLDGLVAALPRGIRGQWTDCPNTQLANICSQLRYSASSGRAAGRIPQLREMPGKLTSTLIFQYTKDGRSTNQLNVLRRKNAGQDAHVAHTSQHAVPSITADS